MRGAVQIGNSPGLATLTLTIACGQSAPRVRFRKARSFFPIPQILELPSSKSVFILFYLLYPFELRMH